MRYSIRAAQNVQVRYKMIKRVHARHRTCATIPKPRMAIDRRTPRLVRFGIPDIGSTGRAGAVEMEAEQWANTILTLASTAEAAFTEHNGRITYKNSENLNLIPESSLFDVRESEFEMLLAGGLDICTDYEDVIVDKLANGAGEIECQMAALGVSPAIFMSHLNVDADPQYSASAPCFTKLSQRSYFTLADYLSTHRAAASHPIKKQSINAHEFQERIAEIAVAISRKLRTAADAGVVKMDLCADDVVFCPKLVEDDDGEITATGFSFKKERGVPFVQHFHNSVRVDYTAYADLAYLLMNAQLHSHIRAFYGPGIQQTMTRRMWGVDAKGRAMQPDELAEDFDKLSLKAALKRMRDHSAASINTFLNEIKTADIVYTLGSMNLEEPGAVSDASVTQDICDGLLAMINAPSDAELSKVCVFPVATAVSGNSDVLNAHALDTKIFACVLPTLRSVSSHDDIDAERALFEQKILE